MIASTYWLARKISSSSLSRLQVLDQACTVAPSAIAATVSATMKMIRMAPDSAPPCRDGFAFTEGSSRHLIGNVDDGADDRAALVLRLDLNAVAGLVAGAFRRTVILAQVQDAVDFTGDVGDVLYGIERR